MMRRYATVWFLSVALALAACAVQPQTFDERLAAAYVTNTQVREAAATALNRRAINVEEGQNVLLITDRVRDILDEASDGDERGLALAIEILESVEEYLP